jgi:hypothetical protein
MTAILLLGRLRIDAVTWSWLAEEWAKLSKECVRQNDPVRAAECKAEAWTCLARFHRMADRYERRARQVVRAMGRRDEAWRKVEKEIQTVLDKRTVDHAEGT